jgi:hypothetical protein
MDDVSPPGGGLPIPFPGVRNGTNGTALLDPPVPADATPPIGADATVGAQEKNGHLESSTVPTRLTGLPAGFRVAAEPSLPAVPNSGGFAATLLSSAVVFISLAAVIAVILYRILPFPMSHGIVPTWWDMWKSLIAPAAGLLTALVAACAFAHRQSVCARPERLDPELYGEIRDRVGTLDALLPVICPGGEPVFCEQGAADACHAACADATMRRNFIAAELDSHGARWVMGSGYIDLYRQLHAAEAALFLVRPAQEVVASGYYDSLRLDGAAEIPNWKTLQETVRKALPLVGGAEAALLTGTPAEAAGSGDATPPTAEQRILGRVVLRDVRQTISEFRDGERAKLVRTRNQLAWTGTITAIAAFALLGLAILSSARPEAVVTGVAYYVIGAAVGLFNQLRNDWNGASGKDDLGFHRARLFYTPVLSGLAAVGGVAIVALLHESVDFGDVASTHARTLEDLLDVKTFSLGLVIAAVFGLTPDLLVDRLQHKADEYRAGLTNTTAIANGTAGK